MNEQSYTIEEIRNILQNRYNHIDAMIDWSVNNENEDVRRCVDMYVNKIVEIETIASIFGIDLEREEQ